MLKAYFPCLWVSLCIPLTLYSLLIRGTLHLATGTAWIGWLRGLNTVHTSTVARTIALSQLERHRLSISNLRAFSSSLTPWLTVWPRVPSWTGFSLEEVPSQVDHAIPIAQTRLNCCDPTADPLFYRTYNFIHDSVNSINFNFIIMINNIVYHR